MWLTADVHHTSAQHYQPSRAAFTDFEPFWEFVSGPLNSGAFPASALDGTFGPERVFVKAPTASNVSPAGDYQFFGEVDIDGDSAEMTVRLREQNGTVLYTKGAPAGPGRPVVPVACRVCRAPASSPGARLAAPSATCSTPGAPRPPPCETAGKVRTTTLQRARRVRRAGGGPGRPAASVGCGGPAQFVRRGDAGPAAARARWRRRRRGGRRLTHDTGKGQPMSQKPSLPIGHRAFVITQHRPSQWVHESRHV